MRKSTEKKLLTDLKMNLCLRDLCCSLIECCWSVGLDTDNPPPCSNSKHESLLFSECRSAAACDRSSQPAADWRVKLYPAGIGLDNKAQCPMSSAPSRTSSTRVESPTNGETPRVAEAPKIAAKSPSVAETTRVNLEGLDYDSLARLTNEGDEEEYLAELDKWLEENPLGGTVDEDNIVTVSEPTDSSQWGSFLITNKNN